MEATYRGDDFIYGSDRAVEMITLRHRDLVGRRDNSGSYSANTEPGGSFREESLNRKFNKDNKGNGNGGGSGSAKESKSRQVVKASTVSVGDTRRPPSSTSPPPTNFIYVASTHLPARLVRIFQWAFGIGCILLLYIYIFTMYRRYIIGDENCSCSDKEPHKPTPDGHDVLDVCMHQSEGIQGEHNGVMAFAKCKNPRFLEESNFITIPWAERSSVNKKHNTADKDAARMDAGDAAPHSGNSLLMQRMYSGLKWECVEYARRYWMLRGLPIPASFDSVDGAEDIWTQCDEVHLQNGSTAPLRKYANGLAIRDGGAAPAAGDLLIYKRNGNDMPYGHVSVVVQVDLGESKVYVAEANWASKIWPGPYYNYSRIVQMKSDGASYELVDTPYTVLGWTRYS